MADGANHDQPEISEASSPRSKLQFGWRSPLPTILQTEAAECGLACLAMVAVYHGHDVDLSSLRRRFSISLKGVTLARLMEIGTQLGLSGRPLKLDLPHLKHLKCPCVLHWDMNHFVVLKRVTSDWIEIHDPAYGARTLPIRDASEHFTGVALELTPTADFKPVRERQHVSLRALTGAFRGIVPSLAQILMLALALEVASLVSPFYLQWVLDQVLVSADRDLLTLLGLGFLGIALFQATITAARAWAVTWLSATVTVQWQSNLVGHLLRLPLAWFEKRHVGDVVSRLNSAQTIQRTLTTQFIGSLLDGVMSLATLVLMQMYSPVLTVLVAGLFVSYGVLRWLFFRPLRSANEDQIVQAARQQSELLEAIRGVLPLKLANQQDDRRARYTNAAVATTNRDVRIQRLTIAFAACNQLVFGIGRVALIWIAALQTLDGRLSVGMMVAFIAYADQFTSRAAGLVDKWVDFRMLKLHGERLADIALTAPEPYDEPGWVGPPPDASIELRNVSFRYAEGEPWLLRNLNLRIEAGESVAITGPSGCGKSTLAKLILGLLEPSEGEILFGGIPIRKLGTSYFRSMVGAVMQDDQLFAGSVADNISLFEPRASLQQVVECAKAAAIDQEIEAMPMGYQTLVGDMGASLSGGQRQRLILARALFRKPKLLVLDEATSHLDGEKEHMVNNAIARARATCIVVAHRHETISRASRVVNLVEQCRT